MFNSVTGELTWAVHTEGYEIVDTVEETDVPDAQLGADFYRPKIQQDWLLKRGVVRAKSEATRTYMPSVEAPSLARRLASMFKIEDPVAVTPSDEEVLSFSNRYGLLIPGSKMYVRDLVQTCKYLHIFAGAIDRGDKAKAREVFNDAVVPGLTVRLVGSKSGKPTAHWKLEVEPINLIALAWLQIAAELTTGRGMQKCEAPDCFEWFPERSNKRFCNNRCKMAYHHDVQRKNSFIRL